MRRLRFLTAFAVACAALAASCTHSALILERDTAANIVAVAPVSGKVGTTATATGTGFGDGSPDSAVTVGGELAEVVSWTATSVTFSVPPAAYPGSRPIVIRNAAGGTSDPFPFAVQLAPAIYVNASGGTTAEPASNHVFGFSIGSDGNLAAMPGSPWSTGDKPISFIGDDRSLDIDAAHRRLFATSTASVLVFAIDGETGVLTPSTPFFPGTFKQNAVVVAPGGDTVYSTSCRQFAVVGMSVSDDGELANLPGSPFPTGIAECGDGLALTKDGRHLYTASEEPTFTGYAVASDGALSLLSASPFLAGGSSSNPRLTPDDEHLLVADFTNGMLYVYVLAADGGLTVSNDSPIAIQAGFQPMEFVQTPIGPDAYRLYAGSTSIGDVRALDLDGSTVSHTFTDPVATVPGTADSMALSADGTRLYLLDGTSQEVSVFAVESDGSLTPLQLGAAIDVLAGAHPNSIRVVP